MNYCVNCGRKRDNERLIGGFYARQLMPFETFLCRECNISLGETTKPLFSCILTDKVVPKARPHVTKTATFFPARYTAWREAASREITEAIREKLRAEEKKPSDLLPFDKDHPVAIFVDFYGSLRGNSDSDNGFGSITDVLAFKGWCLTDDNVQHLPLIYARFHRLPKSTKKNPQVIRTELRIYSLPDSTPILPEKTPESIVSKRSSRSSKKLSTTP